MGRYIYRPVSIDFENSTYESIKNFLNKYKESLKKGELLVDLHNYDIYISNNGLEYPIPVTSTLRKEIIEWIESEEKFNESLKDSQNQMNLKKKKEILNQLMTKIIEYQEYLKENSSDSLDRTLNLEREVKYFYTNLSEYVLSQIIENNVVKNFMMNLFYEIDLEYSELVHDFQQATDKINHMKELYDKGSNMQSRFERKGYNSYHNDGTDFPRHIVAEYYRLMRDVLNDVNNFNLKEDKKDFLEGTTFFRKDENGKKITNYSFKVDLVANSEYPNVFEGHTGNIPYSLNHQNANKESELELEFPYFNRNKFNINENITRLNNKISYKLDIKPKTVDEEGET